MTVFSPELYTLIMSGVFLCLAMMRPDARRDYFTALIMTVVGVAVCVACVRMNGVLFSATWRADLFSQVLKVLLFLGFFLVVCLCDDLDGVEERRHSEFYLLLSTCTLALMLLVSSVHLVTMYVALELSSYSLYVLVYLRKGRNRGIESGMKYFIIGASASAIMLFGLALLYGAGRTAYLSELAAVIPTMIHAPAVIVGLVLTFCGFFFKLAVFPFHFWAPDVYEGAPNQAAAYIATVSKVAAIALLMRIAALTGGSGENIARMLIILSIVSMTVGNLSAIAQKDLKRLFAFSSIAHAGYVLIGVLSMTPAGYASAVFYALAVVLLKFTCFFIVIKVSTDGANIEVADLAGLHRRSPVLALALMMALFGLAGVPPTIGFTGKLLIFTAAVQQGYLVLILIAMFNVVISLYYYLLVLRAAYLLEPEAGAAALRMPPALNALAVALIIVIVFAGIFPNPLIEAANSAARMIL